LGGAGAVFRKVNDTNQANIIATIYGSYSLADKMDFPHPVFQDEKEKSKYVFYEYGFTLLFSNDQESVIFVKQHFRYKHTNRFISADLPAQRPRRRCRKRGQKQKGQIQARRTSDRRTGELNGSLSGSARFRS